MTDPQEAKPASFINLAFDSGRVWEQERIIKLLEQEEAERLGQGGITEALTIRSVIALIKGQSK